MKRLAPADIKSANASGYNYVERVDQKSEKGHGGGKPFRVRTYLPGGGPTRPADFRGPRRATALEAAQDYCNWVNGDPQTRMSKRLKKAGHKRNPRNPNPAGPTKVEQKIAAMEKELRGLKRQREKDSSGRQGYVYCIAETPSAGEANFIYLKGGEPAEAIGGVAVKIGHAVDPHKRIAELQTGNPRKLILLGFIKGTMDDEAAWHQRYHGDNVLQEWFRPTASLLSHFVNQEG